MRSLLRAQTASALLVCAAGVALPAATLILVGRHEVHPGDLVHFYGVGFTAIAATAAAVALTVVGARRSDARTVLVGTAFSVMAALLALHGLATPGMLVGWNGVVAFTGGATLPVGAAILALSALPLASTARRASAAARPPGASCCSPSCSLGAVGMLFPDLVPSVPEASSPLALALLAFGLLLYAFLGVRAINTFLLTRRRADLLVVVGLVLPRHGARRRARPQLHAARLVARPRASSSSASSSSGSRSRSTCAARSPSRSLTGDPRAGELVQAEHAFLGAHVRALTMRLAEKDAYTEGHTRRVALRAVLVGEELGLAPNRLRILAIGGLLHDIGKLSVPDEILKKPGSLDDDEFAVIKRHPEWGHKLLGELGGFSRLGAPPRARPPRASRRQGLPERPQRRRRSTSRRASSRSATSTTRCSRSASTATPGRTTKAMGLLHEQIGAAFDAACVRALERVLARDASLSLGIAV